MTEKIALTLDNEDNFCAFAKATQLKIVEKNNNIWQDVKHFPITLDAKSTNDLRMKIQNIIIAISPCQILLSVKISGIPYYIFDKMGFSIFEANMESNTLMNEILAEIKNNNKETAIDKHPETTVPIKISEGCFYLDYLQLEQDNPMLTTKMILLPFFKNTPFLSLTVRCSHCPPWLKTAEYSKTLEILTEKKTDELLLIIQKKCCKED